MMRMPEDPCEVNKDNWHHCQNVLHLSGYLHHYARPGWDYTNDSHHLRRLRLLVAAALRHIWDWLTDERSRAAVEASELYADDRDPTPLEAAERAAQFAHEELDTRWMVERDAWLAAGSNPDKAPNSTTIGKLEKAAFAAWDASAPDSALTDWQSSACWSEVLISIVHVADPTLQNEAARELAEHGQLRLFHDIFCNPFRPVSLEPSWQTSTAVAIARGMYDSRDFSAMPILADALEDAGCDHADILDHCRGNGPHVRGCWVVDLVLGKS